MELWEPFDVEVDTIYECQVGPLKIWITLSSHEWWIGTQEAGDEDTAEVVHAVSEAPEDIEWQRWARVGDGQTVKLTPVMPDRSVVVRPESAVFFPPRADGTLYARIPVWVRVEIGDSGDFVTLCEAPSCTLSNTWFGEDTINGELCYGMKTRARRTLEEVPMNSCRVICPVYIRNRSDDNLDFERLCVDALHLTVYEYEGWLWTSRIQMIYRGSDRLSAVQYKENWFERPDEVKMVSSSREPVSQGKFKKSFAGFMNFARSG